MGGALYGEDTHIRCLTYTWSTIYNTCRIRYGMKLMQQTICVKVTEFILQCVNLHGFKPAVVIPVAAVGNFLSLSISMVTQRGTIVIIICLGPIAWSIIFGKPLNRCN